jgi:hypothetical protein
MNLGFNRPSSFDYLTTFWAIMLRKTSQLFDDHVVSCGTILVLLLYPIIYDNVEWIIE